jgi:hypothetical protein
MGNFIRNLAFYFFIFVISLSSFSQIVSENDAKTAAYSFIHEMNADVKSIDQLQLSYTGFTTANEPAWYIFTTGPKGYIIIAADELAYPILGYSYNSVFNPQKSQFPSSFEAWMEQRTIEMESIRNHKHPADQTTNDLWSQLKTGTFNGSDVKSRDVAPLLVSQWNQDCQYNELCPSDAAGPCGHVYAGCVATAMGQVMYYWRFPETGNGTYSYYISPYGTQSVNFGATTYKWNEMRGDINSSHIELARLLYHAAVSVGMSFSPSGSGANSDDVPSALKNKFRYQSANYRSKISYSTTNWNNLLKGNLDNKLPIYYSGSGSGGGHAFVCDGYQGTDYFHFDWGWSGYYNGYFYLNNMNPGGNDFNSWQAAVVDIYPPTASYPAYCTGQKTLTALAGSFDDGSSPKYEYQANSNCSWLIQPSVPVDYIQLTFEYFDTESANDIVTIYGGATTSDPVLGTFSGSSLPSYVQSSTQSMLVTFTSNGTTQTNGFLAEYYASPSKFCSSTVVVTDQSGTIEDGSGASYQYANSSNCRWTIQPPGATQINITFTEFSTEPVNDKVRVIDLISNTLVGEYSGTSLPGALQISSSKVQVQFISNATVQGDGWKFNFSTLTDIEENQLSALTVYPNPADDQITIETPVAFSKAIITIYDLSGRTCLSGIQESSGNNSFSIDVSNLSTGMYLIRADFDGNSYFRKLFIQ